MKNINKVLLLTLLICSFAITKANDSSNDTVMVKTKKTEGSGLQYQMINLIGYGIWSKYHHKYVSDFSGLNITTIHGLISKDDSFFKDSFRGIGLTIWNFDKKPFFTLFLNVRLPKYLYLDVGYSKLPGTGAFTYFGGYFFNIDLSDKTRIYLDLAYGGIIKSMLLARIGLSF